jgi:hypothetical protein
MNMRVRMGQSEVNANDLADSRGIIPADVADIIRRTRAEEQWERVDSTVTGIGAERLSRGWFETWEDMAAADELQWFSGRDTSVGPSYTNQKTERTDWAQDIHHVGIEFKAPPGISDIENEPLDAQITPLLFSQELPGKMRFRVILAESDEVANAPGDHFPSGYGVSYPLVSAAAAPTVFAGNNGEPIVSNTWKFPLPLMLAAKAKITVAAQIDQPLRAALARIPGPGSKVLPDKNGGFFNLANWYVIKVTLRGPRYLQLRGARSAA